MFNNNDKYFKPKLVSIKMHFAFETRYSIFTAKVKADSNATAYERLLAGTDTVSIIGYSINLDKRNSRYKPSSGFNFKISQDLAGLGGTSNYIKNSFKCFLEGYIIYTPSKITNKNVHY